MSEDQKYNKILKKLEELSERVRGKTIAEYTEMLRSPKRMIFINFVAGLARGFGFAIGATLLTALFFYFLINLARLNLPVIGEFIAQIVKIVETNL